ncbi:hypothetical protein ASPBRDRAFT_200512 [Aspergillus brasiliensis CBS 101740]|uniref:Altered inheritance of mitochondria protein 6 n=1 Tax=Aspergillus brasiliensis (strain CBS 101740 / IMI 381727 / IBT 21946) TaxID=767769 RepID=A0A1L9U5Q3_ASPBC|nr:hypothetical protein ASPBRDRAFT_200512 [Aspergillus brasiliensis CBS 101740]
MASSSPLAYPHSTFPNHDDKSQLDSFPLDKDLQTSTALNDTDYDADIEASQLYASERPRSGGMRGILALIAAYLSPRMNKKKQHHRQPADARPLLASANDATPSTAWSYSSSRQYQRLKSLSRCLCYPLLGLLVMLGVVQFISIACSIAVSFFPDEFDRAIDRWRHGDQPRSSADILHWPTDISRDIVPVGCHSHNDYWRPVPLFSALQAGCTGVEADVWLVEDDLYVGHTMSALTPQRTLRNLYINPLLRILEQQNPITDLHPQRDDPPQGVFDMDPSQTLILLIDFKTDGQETWNYVHAQLAPLRERGYLSFFNGTDIIPGPITVVGTGNTPFNLVTANATHRDIFFDAPLDKLVDDYITSEDYDDDVSSIPIAPEGGTDAGIAIRATKNVGQGLSGISDADIGPDTFDWTNSYYASVSFKKSIGMPWSFRLSQRQVDQIRAQIRGAHRRGLKVRYWGVPAWPRSLRNHLWSLLVREGVDYLNVDDLRSATRQDWRPRISDWWS